jgi:imidazolonepropionase-like amidohydrolase
MRAVRRFAGKGGLVGAGEDAGFIYRIYGFGYLRELELLQEAGFPPLKVLEQATLNGARVLGRESELGRVRAGWLADLLIVNANPLENFKVLYPHTYGPDAGIEWTIKDGIPYHVPAISEEIRRLAR